MSDLDAILKRSFAQAHEPADDAFVVHVGQAVARKEKLTAIQAWAQVVALAIGAIAAFSGVFILAAPFLTELASGLQTTWFSAQVTLSTISLSSIVMSASAIFVSQAFLALSAVAGGIVLYRSTQQRS